MTSIPFRAKTKADSFIATQQKNVHLKVQQLINFAVKNRTGHLQVQARGYMDKRSLRLVVQDPLAVGNVLDNTPGVTAYTFRTNAFSLVSSNKRTCGVMVIGIEPLREARLSTLEKIIRKGSYLSEDDKDQALVGELLARNLQVGLGDELVVLGQGRDGTIAATVVKIKGIYSLGQDEFDRSSIQITLKNFQDVYSMHGAVHEVVVFGKSIHDVPELKRVVAGSIRELDQKQPLVVVDWMEIMPGLLQSIQLDLVSGLIFWFILIVVVAFSILNTFLMAILERTREFGVLMAIGTTPGRLTRLLLIESTAMTMVGIGVGIIAGSLITWYFQVHGVVISGTAEVLSQYGMPERLHPRLSLLSAFIGPAAVFVITFLTALYPAFKVRGLRPVEAMTAV